MPNADAPQPVPGARTLVLASTSPYRRELLQRLGLPFVTAAPGTDEAQYPDEFPAQTALRLAEQKARSVAREHPQALIIGSDQVANCDGEAIGKPLDQARAIAMLARLSGRKVIFHTGVALLDATTGNCQTACVDVSSSFRTLTRAEIATYVARDRPWDCTGAVKAETLGIALFRAIESADPTALIGLPLIRLVDMLHVAGMHVL